MGNRMGTTNIEDSLLDYMHAPYATRLISIYICDGCKETTDNNNSPRVKGGVEMGDLCYSWPSEFAEYTTGGLSNCLFS
jgi:hypothetical protein